MTDSSDNFFGAGALDANRQGRLTDGQRQSVKNVARASRGNERMVALVAAVFGVIVLALASEMNIALRILIAIGCFAIAFFLVQHSMFGDSTTRDLRAGKVESVEGALRKTQVIGQGTAPTTFYFEVASRRFEVYRPYFESVPEMSYVRLYYLPRSHLAINIEEVPAPPIPQGAMSTPGALFGSLRTALLSHNNADRDAALARFAALGQQIQAAASAAPPPASERDPRPLAEAIIGAWSMGPISVTFDAAGIVSMTTLTGHKQSGHWSVTADGHLQADLEGKAEVGEAWVAGDKLTLSFPDEMTVTLNRTSGA